MPYDFHSVVRKVEGETPLPEFFSLLGDADAAADEVDNFNLDVNNEESDDRFRELLAEESRAVKALVKFVQARGDAILLWMENKNEH